MATTPRFGIERWTSDSDQFSRSQMDTAHVQIESLGAIFRQDTFVNRGSATTYTRSFFYDTTNSKLYYSNGTEWKLVADYGGVGLIESVDPGDTASAGVSELLARADHRHAVAGFGLAASITSTGTALASGVATTYARSDHQHAVGANTVVAGTIATGAVNLSTIFTPGVVDNGAIGAGAVTRLKIDEQERIPTASLMPYAAATAPTGWLLCDGSLKPQSTYSALFALIGSTYGATVGSDFRLPDLRGRVPVGLDNMGGTDGGILSVANTRGGTGGTETHTLTSAQIPAHSHNNTLTDNGHSHTIFGQNSLGNENIFGLGALSVATSNANKNTVSAATGITLTNANNTGGGGSHNNMQPYILMNYIIKT